MLTDASTPWQSITVSNWYGTPQRCLEICSQTAVWFHSGQTPLPIRWVLLRDPQGRFEPQALLCTDPMKDPLCVIGWFVPRWSVEVTFPEVRDHLGFESQRQWTDKAIARLSTTADNVDFIEAAFPREAQWTHDPLANYWSI